MTQPAWRRGTDAARAAMLLLGDAADAPGGPLEAVLPALLAGEAFRHRTLWALAHGDFGGALLGEDVADLAAWARWALPLTSASRDRLAWSRTRGEVLRVVLGDAVFRALAPDPARDAAADAARPGFDDGVALLCTVEGDAAAWLDALLPTLLDAAADWELALAPAGTLTEVTRWTLERHRGSDPRIRIGGPGAEPALLRALALTTAPWVWVLKTHDLPTPAALADLPRAARAGLAEVRLDPAASGGGRPLLRKADLLRALQEPPPPRQTRHSAAPSASAAGGP